MPTFFTSADTTITKRFGVSGVEVPTSTSGARDASFLINSSNAATHNAIEPVVVTSLRALLPLIHCSTTAFGAHAVLGTEVLGQEAVGLGACSKKGQATSAPHRNSDASVHEGFPVVSVIDHVPNGSLAMDIGDSPVVANAIPRATLVLGKRLTRCPNEPPVAWDYDASVCTLPAKLVYHIGRSTPVGID
jgi:hypothetical protein